MLHNVTLLEETKSCCYVVCARVGHNLTHFPYCRKVYIYFIVSSKTQKNSFAIVTAITYADIPQVGFSKCVHYKIIFVYSSLYFMKNDLIMT